MECATVLMSIPTAIRMFDPTEHGKKSQQQAVTCTPPTDSMRKGVATRPLGEGLAEPVRA